MNGEVRLIDADALKREFPKDSDWDYPVSSNSYVCEVIDKMPTIEPEREKGKWLPENRTMDAFWVCSSCGFPSEDHAANILYKFCPNCGADMRGEKDENR